MKSLQVSTHIHPSEQPSYSDLQVLRSAAGWYVGTTYKSPEANFFEPGSRDTDYFATKQEAEYALSSLIMLERFAINSKMKGTRKTQYILERFTKILTYIYGEDGPVRYRLDP
jgi:putative NADH-flavin reductase